MRRITGFFLVLLYLGLIICVIGIPLITLNVAYSTIATFSVFGQILAMIGLCGTVVTDERCQ